MPPMPAPATTTSQRFSALIFSGPSRSSFVFDVMFPSGIRGRGKQRPNVEIQPCVGTPLVGVRDFRNLGQPQGLPLHNVNESTPIHPLSSPIRTEYPSWRSHAMTCDGVRI